MEQYYFNLKSKYMQLFVEEEDAADGEKENGRLYLDDDLAEVCIAWKPKGENMPGFTIHPVWLARSNDTSFKSKQGTTVWIYSTTKPSTRQEVLRLFEVLNKLTIGVRIALSYHENSAKVGLLSKRWKLGVTQKSRPKVDVKYLQSQASTAMQLRAVSVETKKKILRMIGDIADLMHKLDSPEVSLWETRVTRSYKMASMGMASHDLYDLENLKHLRERWHVAKYAAMVAFLKSHERHFDQVKPKLDDIYANAVQATTKRYGFRSAIVRVFQRSKTENIRRARFTASKNRYREAYDRAWSYRVQAYHLRLNICARRIQRAYLRHAAYTRKREIAACVVQRFWRTCLARREFKQLLQLKQEHDRKLRIASTRLAKRTVVACILRWKEYVVLFKQWKLRVLSFRRNVSVKKIQVAVRTHVFKLKRSLILMFKQPGHLHPRVRQLVVDFLTDCDFSRLLAQLEDDYSNRAGIPLRLQESIEREMKLVRLQYKRSTKVLKWPCGLSDSSSVALQCVLAPYMLFRCFNTPSLLVTFWKAMYALHIDYKHYEDNKKQHDIDVIKQLERQLCHRCIDPRAEPLRKDALLRWHSEAELCANCYALFTSKLERRCTRCLSPRYIWSTQQRTMKRTSVHLFVLHAAFFTRVLERTRIWQKHLPEEDKLQFTAEDNRRVLREQLIWNEAVDESRSGIDLLQSAGYNTLDRLLHARASKMIGRFQDWGFTHETSTTLERWCRILRRS